MFVHQYSLARRTCTTLGYLIILVFLVSSCLVRYASSVHISVYLQADPQIVYDRIRKRNRKEERGITSEFLEGLHRYTVYTSTISWWACAMKCCRLHEDWLIYRNSTTNAPIPGKQWVYMTSARLQVTNTKLLCSRIFVINTSPSYEEMMALYKKVAQKIWYNIPSELKGRPCWMNWQWRTFFLPELICSIIIFETDFPPELICYPPWWMPTTVVIFTKCRLIIFNLLSFILYQLCMELFHGFWNGGASKTDNKY